MWMRFGRFIYCLSLLIISSTAGAHLAAASDIQNCKSINSNVETDAAYEACDRALLRTNLMDHERAVLLLRRGEAAYWAASFDRALADLDEALRFNPDLNEAYLRRAWIKKKTQQHAGALQDLSTILSRDPDNADVHFAIGYFYKDTPAWKTKTMPAFKRALELNPDHHLTRFNLAQLYYNRYNEMDRALAEYDIILRASDEELSKIKVWREPGEPKFDLRAETRIGRAYVRIQLQDFPKALAEFNDLVTLYPQRSDVLSGRSQVYSAIYQYSEALIDAEAAIKINPYGEIQKVVRVKALYHLGRLEEALTAADKVLNSAISNQSRGEVLFWRAYINKKLDRPEDVLRNFEQSFALEPHFLKGSLYRLKNFGYYEGEMTDNYSERARNGLQACIVDPEC